jgi:hypothetical protein
MMYSGPADAEWKKDDLGDPITTPIASRGARMSKARAAKLERPKAHAKGEDEGEDEPVDLNDYTVVGSRRRSTRLA